MESKMKVFENKEFGFVRTVMVGNEPWFAGKDVAAASDTRIRRKLSEHTFLMRIKG